VNIRSYHIDRDNPIIMTQVLHHLVVVLKKRPNVEILHNNSKLSDPKNVLWRVEEIKLHTNSFRDAIRFDIEGSQQGHTENKPGGVQVACMQDDSEVFDGNT